MTSTPPSRDLEVNSVVGKAEAFPTACLAIREGELMECRRDLGRATTGESGASSIEYAFLASLIALVIILGVEALGLSLRDIFADAASAF